MAKQFFPFDPAADVAIHERHLPHWFQPGAAIFVTFRTADSMPREVVERWHQELVHFLEAGKHPVKLADFVVGRRASNHDALLDQLSPKQQFEFKRLSDRVFHRSLDELHGSCPFRRADLAKIVGDAIRHFDGQRYDLDRYVVMPNHVHAIVQFYAGFDLSLVSESWMRYTARQINRAIHSQGALWQPEPFDHIIRSADQFRYLRGYIADNSKKANLSIGEYLYWESTE